MEERCDNRCVIDGMGSPLRKQSSLRHMDGYAVTVEHKLLRAEGSIREGLSRSYPTGQHSGVVLHQSQRGYSLSPAAKAFPFVGGEE